MLTKESPGALTNTAQSRQAGLLIGKLVSINSHGNPMIAYDEQTKNKPIEALTTVPLTSTEIGQDVAVSFAQNQGGTAIVMGVIRRVLDDVLNLATHKIPSSKETQDPLEVVEKSDKPEILVDGTKLEISAADEITLRCGKSSITLNKSGKILIKGEHILNRTSGSHKIKSGSIQLN